MQFVHPEVLWALSALTIPVLVHLFSFRRHRKVSFSQTAFLKEVRMESRSRNRIRNWLVLLLRLAAMACIVLAFAEHMWPTEEGDGNGGQKRVSVYMDTSPSMELEGRSGPMLEAAKNGALALVESHAATDRFHVVSSSFDPADRRWLTKEEALERIASVQAGHASPNIRDVLFHQQEFLSDDSGDQCLAYLFTDLQQSSHTLTGENAGMVDSTLFVRFVTQSAQPKVNIRVDSAWFDTPMRLVGRSEVLHVRIAHDAQRPVDDLPLSLSINGRKVQGTAYTSHAQPGLQALIEVEKTENIVQFLMTLQRLWAKHCPDKPPLETWVKQVHTDFHPALEAARKIRMGRARPCKDFFHLMQKQPTLEKKLSMVSSQPGQHVKENKGWLLFSLHIQRHLPTLDLSSAIYTGFLQRLRAKGEHDIRSYLGPGGHAPYCVQATARELRTVYGVSASNPNEDAQLLFSLHWTGLWGALPGADCGDQPLEAFHSRGKPNCKQWATNHISHWPSTPCRRCSIHGDPNCSGRAHSHCFSCLQRWT